MNEDKIEREYNQIYKALLKEMQEDASEALKREHGLIELVLFKKFK